MTISDDFYCKIGRMTVEFAVAIGHREGVYRVGHELPTETDSSLALQ